ncbi:hypothetical protein L861_05980 [Litchfieldella anticariensis FP35 = DSM 16096]|uniref:STAS domain-containing protein n=1 Tax=Litchfieldella anticariensis (strain DSM 16096 / CECT 5854 / CIP 108499 / LMG 22089 / FP35) TaxID=1121939 RepID=S2KE78_LITA3|nr:STAS domain-containing protein [Halomonas anticariensis]EPC00487.1 hypothetical protein L861_05980 [Halomonas anticariensis FP35 = DSM 16096]
MGDTRETEVRLEGTLGLRDVEAVRERLEAALKSETSVVVDVKKLVDVDISVLQLLLSARVSAMHRGIELRFVTSHGDVLHEAMDRAGIFGVSR